jgi:hypothetical protein
MTMLIAGHETTAAVLTWSVFLLAQVHRCYHKILQVINFLLEYRMLIMCCHAEPYQDEKSPGRG